jgi:ASPIC/UnbV protein
LVPNRLFKNVDGHRFVDVTTSSGTGHLQKGHAVACGDWDRDGNVDLFVEVGGGTPGDRFRNVLFQNPGHANHWLTVKLVGKKTNRAAIGARIKVTPAGEPARSIYRHVSSGSSFGANPLQQTIGIGKAEKIAAVEVYWPTSRTTQIFRDVPVDGAVEITEFAPEYRRLKWPRVPLPR